MSVPNDLQIVVGKYDNETKSYNAYGNEGQVGYWYEALIKCFGGVVAANEVSMFVPASRMAIHKRVKEGRLTVFNFHSEPATKGLFFNKKEKRERAYTFVPICECRSWANEIKARKLRLDQMTKDEIEAERPEWYGYFHDTIMQDDSRLYQKEDLEERTTQHLIELGLLKSQEEQVREHIEHLKSLGIDVSALTKGEDNE